MREGEESSLGAKFQGLAVRLKNEPRRADEHWSALVSSPSKERKDDPMSLIFLEKVGHTVATAGNLYVPAK